MAIAAGSADLGPGERAARRQLRERRLCQLTAVALVLFRNRDEGLDCA
jgi:hypothetical protein